MARNISQHYFVTPEVREHFNPENSQLEQNFLQYLTTIDKSPATIKTYQNDLSIIWFWNLQENNNKRFVDWTKMDIINLQRWCIEECNHSTARITHLKAVMSSMSNYIEMILDDVYPDFRKISNRIPNPTAVAKLDKSVFSMHDINILLQYLTFHCQYDRACCLALAVCSGRRKSELIQFKLSDFTDDRLVCDGALYKSAPIRTKGRGRTGKLLECYVLAQQFKPYLDRWMDYRNRHHIDSEYLFPSPQNPETHITKYTLDSWANVFSDLLPLPFYWHAMRHLTVTNFKRARIPDSIIQDYIQWSSAEMIRVYNDMDKEELFAMYFNADGTYGGTEGKLSDVNL